MTYNEISISIQVLPGNSDDMSELSRRARRALELEFGEGFLRHIDTDVRKLRA